MSVTFSSQALNDLYTGATAVSAGANTAALTAFRGGQGLADLSGSIAALDSRIASFESVLIGQIGSGLNSADYPYDREGLRREFLDELLGVLLGSDSDSAANSTRVYDIDSPASSSTLITAAGTGGGTKVGLRKLVVYGGGNFANLTPSATHADIASDFRLSLLNAEGGKIFITYSRLIDEIFAEGDKLGGNPVREVQNVSAIAALVVDGVTYDRMAVVSGYDPVAEIPTFDSYLLDANAVTSKAGSGGALSGPALSSASRLRLQPIEAPPLGPPNTFRASLAPFFTATVTVNPGDVRLELSTGGGPVAATPLSPPLVLNVPGRGHEFPDVRLVVNQRATGPDGVTYLIGLSSENKVYVTSLSSNLRGVVGTTASLSGLDYLVYFNEARISILRAKLAYNEAVVREIQEDLRQANAALADLETQAGAIVATNSDGTLSYQSSVETFRMGLFNAQHSKANDTIFSNTGFDILHSSAEWQQNRVKLKNYIDRRSSEAQQATLDYQNTLNRFNNAFEIMAKLQEKLDTLLKAQLRNF